MNGFGPTLGNSSSLSEMLPNGHSSRQEAGTEQADGHSESVLILGLRGQRHDLER